MAYEGNFDSLSQYNEPYQRLSALISRDDKVEHNNINYIIVTKSEDMSWIIASGPYGGLSKVPRQSKLDIYYVPIDGDWDYIKNRLRALPEDEFVQEFYATIDQITQINYGLTYQEYQMINKLKDELAQVVYDVFTIPNRVSLYQQQVSPLTKDTILSSAVLKALRGRKQRTVYEYKQYLNRTESSHTIREYLHQLMYEILLLNKIKQIA